MHAPAVFCVLWLLRQHILDLHSNRGKFPSERTNAENRGSSLQPAHIWTRRAIASCAMTPHLQKKDWEYVVGTECHPNLRNRHPAKVQGPDFPKNDSVYSIANGQELVYFCNCPEQHLTGMCFPHNSENRSPKGNERHVIFNSQLSSYEGSQHLVRSYTPDPLSPVTCLQGFCTGYGSGCTNSRFADLREWD